MKHNHSHKTDMTRHLNINQMDMNINLTLMFNQLNMSNKLLNHQLH